MHKNSNKNDRLINSCWKRRRNNTDDNKDEECGGNVDELKALNKTKEKENELTVLTSAFADHSKKSVLSMKSTMSENCDYSQLKSLFVNNMIRIQDSNGLILNNKGSYYLNFRFKKDESTNLIKISEQLRYVPKFMSTLWKLKNPKIIIPIITGLSNFKNWKNRKLEDQFKRGIIKAANKTEMWFITNGINGGISQLVGDALSEEMGCRSTNDSGESNGGKNGTNQKSKVNQNLDLKPIVLIGIVDAETLQNFSMFDGADNVLVTASGNKISAKKEYRFDLNADHTHFIIYDESKLQQVDKIGYNQFRSRLESLFTKSLSHYKRALSPTSEVSDDDMETTKPNIEHRQIPMVCLTIRGDLNTIEAIDFKVRKEIPVIILKGSGGAADIITFAYEEMTENKDPNYEEGYIKPELNKKLLEEFNEELKTNDVIRNQYRDKILSIVRSATRGTQKFLTIVDMKGLAFDFSDIDKYILTALLQSQTEVSGKSGKAQVERNLRLTLDWKCPEIALSEIFQRDDYKQIEIKHGLFENAILRLDREEFVELFLDQGFCIHRYLGRNNIRDLFERAENRDFFVTVILQGILGHFTSELPDNFLPEGLNYVLKKLTSIDHMVNILEIYMNQLGFYVTDAKHAEKRALNFLIIFAVLMNRHKLAKMLWKRTEDPVPVALVCSLMYKNLLLYCQENYIKTQIEKRQNDFAECAVGVLDMSFKENDPRAYIVLQDKFSDWNNSTALELAYNSKNRNFIAHPCCQKILTKRLFGNIQVREFKKSFFLFDFPNWIKVILCAFFVIPMYYWIVFPVEEKKTKTSEHVGDEDEDDLEEKDEEKEEEEDTKRELNRKLMKEMRKNRRASSHIRQSTRKIKSKNSDEAAATSAHQLSSRPYDHDPSKQKEKKKFVTPPIHKKIYMIWTAPYTKFWINFLSYICYLMLFGLVTLWPSCGNLLLDSSLWFWTATITVEDTRIAYYKYFNGSQLPLGTQIIEILIMIVFLVLFLSVRIIGIWNYHADFFGNDRIFFSKGVLCFFLLYFYYRTVFIFLPISHKLGPMLVRMKLMIKRDFTTYLRLFLIFMTAGSIALNAILYPFYPVNLELFKRVILFRGFMQLFAADKSDLEAVTEKCRRTNLSHRARNESYECVNLVSNSMDFRYEPKVLESYGISYDCNYMSLVAWFILIQYFLLVKLFLPTLLTAMFSATGQLVSSQSEQLWMFQRYEIVLDYENRLTFPPPFTFISYIYMFFEWLFYKLMCFWQKCRVDCKNMYSKDKDDEKQLTQQQQQQKIEAQLTRPSTNVYHYWRALAKSYDNQTEKEEKEKQKQKYVETSLNKVREDLDNQKKSVQRLSDRVISLEKATIQNQSYLEVIKNILAQQQSKLTLLDRQKSNYIHILSRESPYIFTNISRFFVYEKLVPWECPYDAYDPPFISLSAEFLKVEAIFVDTEPNQKLVAGDDTSSTPKPQFDIGTTPQVINQTTLNTTTTATTSDSPQVNTCEATPTTSAQAQAQQLQSQRRGSVVSLTAQNKQVFLWNAVMTIDLSDGKQITVDRKSWINKVSDDKAQSTFLIYKLDPIGLPKNPFGRTGIRGRGALYRYGPNHEIMAIVTRWKKFKNKPIYVDRRKVLEFIACKDLLSQMKIPGDKILGDESKFSVVCRTFIELVFEETEVERVTSFNEDEMKTFFASFASTRPIDTRSTESLTDQFNDLGFFTKMMYRGYIDDQRNTDNAWIEAEIWNFHYDREEFFDKRIKNPTSKWREVSSNVRIHSNEIIVDVLKEVAEYHDAFYN